MTRIEANEQNQLAEIEQKMERMEKQLHRSQRRVFSCFNCLVYFLILMLVGSFFVFSAVAKTGLIKLPYFTEKYYTVPAPAREVEPIEVSQASFGRQIQTQAADEFLAGESSADVTLAVSEGYLTKTVQDYLNRKNDNYEQAQVAIEPEYMEIFLHKKDSKIYLTGRVLPKFEDGKVEIKFVQIRLGHMPMPSSLANLILKYALADSTNQLNAWLKDYGQITGIRLEQGRLLVDLEISKKSLNLNGR